jgi:hypothetical protein
MDKYLISIDDELGEDLGIKLISFVKKPAILVKGIAFNRNYNELKFSKDDVKMRIVAPAMIPMDIYRYSPEEDYEYEVRFTKEVIEKIRDKFMKNLSNRNIFNLEHTDEIVPAYILETWIVGDKPELDKSYSEYAIDVPSGTLMIMTQITDRDYYNKLVENEQFSYSIEGFFGLEDLKFIMQKNKKKFMEQLKLPDGHHQIDDKIYFIENGEVLKIEKITKEEKSNFFDNKNNTEKEEDFEEEKVDSNENNILNESEIIAILQPKFDEIYKLIADLSYKIENIIENKQEKENVTEDYKMSITDKFNNLQKFLKGK